VPDISYRSALLVPAYRWLFGHGDHAIAMALYRASIIDMDRATTGDLFIGLRVDNRQDRDTLATATRSCSGAEMPGPLDLAFEIGLPDHEWPIFWFWIADEQSSLAG
jgi:hypothetical protein